jgi:hypothetical protein
VRQHAIDNMVELLAAGVRPGMIGVPGKGGSSMLSQFRFRAWWNSVDSSQLAS